MVVEKQRVSDLTCTGLYHFKNTSRFLADAEAILSDPPITGDEYYIAPIYQRMIDRGEIIRVHVAEEFASIGTADELADFRRRIERR
jgi:dTDP-glucose pyrophosphorylase